MPTKIEWATETWSPITGCTPISEGCQNCYAKRMAQRLRGRFGYPKDDPFRVTFHPERLDQPMKWKKPRRIFVCSMGDLFHKDVPMKNTYGKIFDAAFMSNYGPRMKPKTPHTFLFLTKRPERMSEVIHIYEGRYGGAMPNNMWWGVTAENQKRADERIPILLQIPTAKRFVSIEPMLGPVKLGLLDYAQSGDSHSVRRSFLDWVIVGGESGPGARPMNPDWARGVRDQCREAGVPFFMKQMSGTGAERQRIPVDLQIRQYPD